MPSADDDVVFAVELLDRLLESADGGRDVNLGSYAASTVIALLTDKQYRMEVMQQIDDFADARTFE